MTPTFSILINNFNYAIYLRQCIDSALGQTWGLKEVIVVDDGSSDDSREIISSYGGQIYAVYKPNGGQGSALNEGFKRATGSIIIFLDADDLLKPAALETIAPVMNPGVSKIQFRLSVIDETGNPLKAVLPTAAMKCGDEKKLLARFGVYTSPPGSGNAYAKVFLNAVLPMPVKEWKIAADAYLIFSAPFYGDIITINKELGCYRRHGKGASDINFFGKNSLKEFVDKELVKESLVRKYAASLLKKHDAQYSEFKHLSPFCAKYYLIEKRLNAQTISCIAYFRLLASVVASYLFWPGYTLKQKFNRVVWALVIGLAPITVVVYLSSVSLLPHLRANNCKWSKPKRK